MSADRKRKWDQPGDDDAVAKAAKTDESQKSATAAAAAAAIAAKIAAQFAGPSGPSSSLGAGAPGGGTKDPHDGEFTHDIEINDVRNRYLLTKGATQQQIQVETGASVTTKGVWYPDKSKATEKDPPLYLHISGSTQAMVDAAIAQIEEKIAADMGSLVEDRRRDDKPRERRKWPEEKLPVGLDTIRNFNVRAKVVGPQGAFVKYIQSETSTRVQIKGIGSGFYEQETNQESNEPMHIHITGPDELMVARAKELTEDLLIVVRQEHQKARTAMMEQQLQLQQAQAQYAAYNAYNGYAPPPPSDAPPPPPPTDAPPPPPPEDGSGAPPPPPPSGGAPGADGSPPAQQTAAEYAAYWAAYGYDVNSEAFKEWQAQQQQQYAAYYAAQGYPVAVGGTTTTAGGGALAPNSESAPPPPPSSDPPPPPPPA